MIASGFNIFQVASGQLDAEELDKYFTSVDKAKLELRQNYQLPEYKVLEEWKREGAIRHYYPPDVVALFVEGVRSVFIKSDSYDSFVSKVCYFTTIKDAAKRSLSVD